MFITTANTLERIPRPLQDRMEIIRIAGLHRAREAQHREAVPGAEAARGERPRARATSSSPTTRCSSIIRHYTQGSGRPEPRARDRRRSAARSRVEVVEERPQTRTSRSRAKSLPKYLGPAEVPLRQGRGGATRSAWRPASRGPSSAASCSPPRSRSCPARASSSITGKLGEVMQESAQAAMSYVRSRAERARARARLLPEDRHPHSRARGRDPEGRPVGRHHAWRRRSCRR